jgi:hypothetical protein
MPLYFYSHVRVTLSYAEFWLNRNYILKRGIAMNKNKSVMLLAGLLLVITSFSVSAFKDLDDKKKGTHLALDPAGCTSSQPTVGLVTGTGRTLTANTASTGCVCVEPHKKSSVKLHSVSTTAVGCFAGGTQTISKNTCFPYENVYWTLIPDGGDIMYTKYEKGGYGNSSQCGGWGKLDMR